MPVTIEQYLSGFRDTAFEPDAAAEAERVGRILDLARQNGVLILGHNYMPPLIFALSDRQARGDSLALAQHGVKAPEMTILLNGVLFMAETAKILSPEKTVLIASKEAGCSLADPIRAEQVRQVKREHPGAPVVTYVNSYADVKAESDICCTSAMRCGSSSTSERRAALDGLSSCPIP